MQMQLYNLTSGGERCYQTCFQLGTYYCYSQQKSPPEAVRAPVWLVRLGSQNKASHCFCRYLDTRNDLLDPRKGFGLKSKLQGAEIEVSDTALVLVRR